MLRTECGDDQRMANLIKMFDEMMKNNHMDEDTCKGRSIDCSSDRKMAEIAFTDMPVPSQFSLVDTPGPTQFIYMSSDVPDDTIVRDEDLWSPDECVTILEQYHRPVPGNAAIGILDYENRKCARRLHAVQHVENTK